MGVDIDSFILTDIGYKKISSLVGKNLGIYDFDTPLKIITDGYSTKTINSYKINPVSKIYKLVLEDGHSIIVNPNTKFMTIFRNKIKFRRIEDLKIGHYLFTSLGSGLFNEKDMKVSVKNKYFTYYDNNLSYLLGLLLSAGKLQDDKCYFYQIIGYSKDKCKEILSSFCDTSNIKNIRVRATKYDIEINAPLFVSFLKDTGFENFDIPLEILTNSKDSIYWFLRGLSSGINMVNTKKTSVILNKNEETLIRLQLLLNFIGVKNVRKSNCISFPDYENGYFRFVITKGAKAQNHKSERYRLVKELLPELSDNLIRRRFYPVKIKEIKIIGERRTVSFVIDKDYIVNSFIIGE